MHSTGMLPVCCMYCCDIVSILSLWCVFKNWTTAGSMSVRHRNANTTYTVAVEQWVLYMDPAGDWNSSNAFPPCVCIVCTRVPRVQLWEIIVKLWAILRACKWWEMLLPLKKHVSANVILRICFKLKQTSSDIFQARSNGIETGGGHFLGKIINKSKIEFCFVENN